MVDYNFLKDNPDLASNMRFEITGEQIMYLIEKAVKEITKRLKRTKEKKLLSEDDACKFLGLTRQTLHAYRKAGKITYHVLGSRIYYLESELIDEMSTIKKKGVMI
jgi:ACT domain-containing protein